jgi:Family of unknown function (DUF6496)
MPLKSGSSTQTVSHNIEELHSGPTYAHTKGKFGAERANKQAVAIALSEARKTKRAKGGKVHIGPIRGKDGGRTDVHEMKVADGSYVLSADVVSHLGENNSEAGLHKAKHLFGEGGHFDGAEGRKSGGATSSAKPVDCITAGGEFVIPPSVVKQIGKGDIDLGHKILDRFSMNVRKDHIATLAKLPPPAQD